MIQIMEPQQAITHLKEILTLSVRTLLLVDRKTDITAWYIESPTSAEPLMEGAPKSGRSFYTSLGHLDSSKSNTPSRHG